MAMRKYDPVAAFLARHTIRCQALAIRLTPEECAARQTRDVESTYFGRVVKLNNDPLSRYCYGGCCAQGMAILKKLAPKAYREKKKLARGRKAPCRRITMGRSEAPAWVGER
jgi:hypothetical protein